MKHIKLFENFEHKDTEFNKFRGIDISDIYSFSFIWTNNPHISDYKKIDGEYGSSEKRIDIYYTIKNIISDSEVTKEQFRKILEKNFNVDISTSGSPSIESESPSYSVILEGQDILAFFDILENINYYI